MVSRSYGFLHDAEVMQESWGTNIVSGWTRNTSKFTSGGVYYNKGSWYKVLRWISHWNQGKYLSERSFGSYLLLQWTCCHPTIRMVKRNNFPFHIFEDCIFEENKTQITYLLANLKKIISMWRLISYCSITDDSNKIRQKSPHLRNSENWATLQQGNQKTME